METDEKINLNMGVDKPKTCCYHPMQIYGLYETDERNGIAGMSPAHLGAES